MLIVTPASRLLLFHLHASCCCLLLSYHAVAGAAASPFSFSFDFSNRSTYRYEDLKFEGDAAPQGQLVDLTCSSRAKPRFNCKGRMSYNYPVPFYDTTTGEVASFSTRFNFTITLPGKYPGDGMAFFLSGYPSMLPLNSGGGNLGLQDGDGANGTNRFVAVEFDTYKNTFDTMFEHIGIDINTVQTSVKTTSVNGSMIGNMTASITFNSSTRMLVASLHFNDQPSRASYQVSAELSNPVSDLLPSEVAVGFSAATGLNIELHQITAWSFNSTLARKAPRNRVLYALLMGGPFVLLVLLAVVILFSVACYKHIHRDDSFVKGVGDLAKRFEYRELAVATDEFSDSRELGEGAFGIVYEGILTDQVDGQRHRVAVKKIKGTNGEIKDFHAELKTISETRHKNLVRLKGWCCRSSGNFIDFMFWWRQKRSVELFLVYELVPNGNLDVHLNKNDAQVLAWSKRYNIVKGIGSALRYLHHECSQCILHRDIKPGNILLDEQFNAKLADFGLSRIAHLKNEALPTTIVSETSEGDANANPEVLTRPNGTIAYMDPMCMKDGIVSINLCSDVYSFGIVLLEIACTGKSRAEVWDVYKRNPENMSDAADARLNGDFDVDQMHHVAVLGLWCSLYDDTSRPSMKEATEVLEHDAPLPNLIGCERGVAGYEGNGADGTCYSAASLAIGGPLAQHRKPTLVENGTKDWPFSTGSLRTGTKGGFSTGRNEQDADPN